MADEVEDAEDAPDSPDTEAIDATETPSEDVDAEAEATEETPSEEEAEAEAEAQESAHQKALAKHKGDPEALAKHYFETMTQAADKHRSAEEAKARADRLEEINKELIKALQSKAPPEPEVEDEPEPPPELGEYDSEIEALQKKADAIPAGLEKLGVSYRKVQGRIASLQEKLADADDIDKRDIKDRIASYEDQAQTLEATFEAKKDNETLIQAEIKRLAREKAKFEREHERQLESDRANHERNEQEKADYASWVEDSIAKAIKAEGIPDARTGRASKVIYDSLMAHLMVNKPTRLIDPQVRKDSAALIAAEAKSYAEEVGVSKAKDFKVQTERKLATARKSQKPARVETPRKPNYDPLKEAEEGFNKGMRARMAS